MGLVLKYVENTKSGIFQYRRRVPKEILGIIGKTMFKKKLGDSRKEALAAYPRHHAQVEREIAEAHNRLARASGLSIADLSDREAYAEASHPPCRSSPPGSAAPGRPCSTLDVAAEI